jgi:zinc D-Ala-D-Ala carboxypeptidase
MTATYLSAHFTLEELTVSQEAARRGIDNTPPEWAIHNLEQWCIHIGEPVRAHFGAPVIASSGWRGELLNRLVKGSPTSQHCKGEAVDFRVFGVSNLAVCRWMEAELNYDQLIYEFGETGWVHASWRVPYRNMELSAVKRGRRTVYLPGIVA